MESYFLDVILSLSLLKLSWLILVSCLVIAIETLCQPKVEIMFPAIRDKIKVSSPK